MHKILTLSILAILALASNVYASNPLILSLNVTQQNSKFTLPSSENKSKGYTTMATLTKQLNDGWFVTGILGYSDLNVDTISNNGSQDVNVDTYGLAITKSLGVGLTANAVVTYGRTSTDSSLISSGTSSSYSNDSKSLVVSGGLNQIVRYSASDYTSVGISLTNVSSSTDSYFFNGTRVDKSDSDYSYVTLKAKQTWIINGYKPSVSLQYTRANENYSQTNDKDYFRLGAGLKKDIMKDLTLGLSYSTIQSKDYNSNNSYGLNLTKKF